jgi:uncharacterized protein (DUF2164 family)
MKIAQKPSATDLLMTEENMKILAANTERIVNFLIQQAGRYYFLFVKE